MVLLPEKFYYFQWPGETTGFQEKSFNRFDRLKIKENNSINPSLIYATTLKAIIMSKIALTILKWVKYCRRLKRISFHSVLGRELATREEKKVVGAGLAAAGTTQL